MSIAYRRIGLYAIRQRGRESYWTTGAGREILLPEFEPKNGHALDKNSPLG